MRSFSVISKAAGVGIAILAGTMCLLFPEAGLRGVSARESRPLIENFDPLELNRDTVSIPIQVVQAARLAEAKRSDSMRLGPQRRSSLQVGDLGDSARYQSFRVQLSTSETYGESRHALQVAEEIFDQPVFLDYDIPYFKLRVGDFRTRSEADLYALKAKAAGYPNAWVVAVNVSVRQAAPLYDQSLESAPDSLGSVTPRDSR